VILNSFFDRVVLINLARRGDRLERFTEQATALGLKFERFEAIDAQKSQLTPPQACAASHREVVTQAKADGVGRLLIFEDDASFSSTFVQECHEVLDKTPEDWQMLYLGSWPHSIMPVNDRVALTHGTICTHALGYKAEVFDLVIEASLGTMPIDEELSRRHSSIKTYMAHPSIVEQRPDFSDIRGHEVDYSGFIR
jgi:GR25 family glycosyltransferase involved in LPS biosynthesis